MKDNFTTRHCSPCRGKIISGTEGSPRDGTHPRSLRRRNDHIWPCHVFFKNLGKRPSFGIIVN